MAMQANDATVGSVSWDGDMACYKGIRLDLVGLNAMVQAAIYKAESTLYGTLLCVQDYDDQTPAGMGLPDIPGATLLDNAADANIGQSVVDKILEHDPNSKGWLFRKIWTSNLKAAWLPRHCSSQRDGSELDPKQVAAYGRSLEELLESILFLTHICGGQPVRAPELLTIRHRNTANGGIRNVLVDDGLVMIVAGYHKGFSKMEREKIVHWFLPREVGGLLVYYLWLVLLFWEAAQANALAKEELSPNI